MLRSPGSQPPDQTHRTLAAAPRALALCALSAIGLLGRGYWACQTSASRQNTEERIAGAPAGREPGRAPKKAKKAFCEAGVQGPVHYTGDRYVHASQGFGRAWEIERVPAAKPHRE